MVLSVVSRLPSAVARTPLPAPRAGVAACTSRPTVLRLSRPGPCPVHAAVALSPPCAVPDTAVLGSCGVASPGAWRRDGNAAALGSRSFRAPARDARAGPVS
eukprot:15075880-Alexandrium_andersonii.AAC.1